MSVQENELAPAAINIDEISNVLNTLEGKHGLITIVKPNRDINESDEDIHSLIARILIKKEKRIASGG